MIIVQGVRNCFAKTMPMPIRNGADVLSLTCVIAKVKREKLNAQHCPKKDVNAALRPLLIYLHNCVNIQSEFDNCSLETHSVHL